MPSPRIEFERIIWRREFTDIFFSVTASAAGVCGAFPGCTGRGFGCGGSCANSFAPACIRFRLQLPSSTLSKVTIPKSTPPNPVGSFSINEGPAFGAIIATCCASSPRSASSLALAANLACKSADGAAHGNGASSPDQGVGGTQPCRMTAESKRNSGIFTTIGSSSVKVGLYLYFFEMAFRTERAFRTRGSASRKAQGRDFIAPVCLIRACTLPCSPSFLPSSGRLRREVASAPLSTPGSPCPPSCSSFASAI